ncbi:hypothetical protein Ciccas_004802 [Cichlidogyrus casuarinus]|uniref:Uncharacterized protein n=1 Tax=Cichlidogyrus casuarinus TaxID=1844966 RepID=A0ABD2QAJ9_9PLAT
MESNLETVRTTHLRMKTAHIFFSITIFVLGCYFFAIAEIFDQLCDKTITAVSLNVLTTVTILVAVKVDIKKCMIPVAIACVLTIFIHLFCFATLFIPPNTLYENPSKNMWISFIFMSLVCVFTEWVLSIIELLEGSKCHDRLWKRSPLVVVTWKNPEKQKPKRLNFTTDSGHMITVNWHGSHLHLPKIMDNPEPLDKRRTSHTQFNFEVDPDHHPITYIHIPK